MECVTHLCTVLSLNSHRPITDLQKTVKIEANNELLF